jgi:sulfoxide reductase heme-binding subunit YedZ
MTRNTGSWAIYILLLTLAITPAAPHQWLELAENSGVCWVCLFFYASLHLTMYLWFDHFFEWETIWPDIIKRPFVLAGMVSWGMMLALAISSPQAVLRWMGGKRWQRLHQLMYVLVPVAVLHVYWMKAGKHDFFWPAVYGGLTVLLLVCGSGLRVVLRVRSEEMFGFFCCNRIKIEILCTAAHNFRSQTETGIIMQSYLLKPGQTKGITRKLALLVLGLFGWKCFISPCPDRAASSSFIRIHPTGIFRLAYWEKSRSDSAFIYRQVISV